MADAATTTIENSTNKSNQPSRNGNVIGDLNYPDNNLDAWCNIRIFKYAYRPESTPGAAQEITNPISNIQLPLPLQLATGYQQEWNDTDMFTALAAQGATNLSTSADVVEFAKNLAARPEAAGISAAAMASYFGAGRGATGAVGLGVTGGVRAALATKGYTSNKYESVTYEKPQLRTHQFSWNLVAKSASEGQSIQNIIRKLKYHSHPDGGGGAFYEYPELFKVHFSPKNLFSVGPSVLESFTVDYHAAGRPLYHAADEMPISVTINCTFKETTAVTKDLIEKANR